MDSIGDAVGGPVREGTVIGLFESIWRRRVALVVVVALAAISGYLIASGRAPTYEAKTTLLFLDATGSPFDQSSLPGQDHERYLATQADRVTSAAVTGAAARALGDGTSARDIATGLSAVPGSASDTLTITGTAPKPERAAQLADAGASGYLAVLRDDARTSAASAATRLQRQYDIVRRQLDGVEATQPGAARNAVTTAMQDQLRIIVGEQSRLLVAAEEYQPSVQVVSAAATPSGPVSPVPLRDAALAVLIAVLAASTAAWAFEARAQRRSDPGRITRLLGAQCLGRVPEGAATPTLDPATGEPSLSGRWQQIVLAVDASLRSSGGQCVVVTSPTTTAGSRPTVCTALAASADGRSVVVVDADHATRELSTLAGAATLPGLTELAEGASDVVRNGGGQRSGWMVSLLPVGRRVVNPAAFYRTVSFRAALASVGRIADLVLVVAPPVLGQADASILADAADAVLLVLTESVTDEELRQAKTSLSWSRGALLGYVLIEQPESRFASRRTPPAVEVDDGASTPPQDSTWSLSAFLEPLRVVPRTGNPINGRGAAPPVHRGRAPVRVASSSGKEQPA